MSTSSCRVQVVRKDRRNVIGDVAFEQSVAARFVFRRPDRRTSRRLTSPTGPRSASAGVPVLSAPGIERIGLATIYVALSRMERRGFVRSWMSSPTPVRGGKSKKYYQLEPAGTEALREAKATLERMWQGVGTTLDPSSA
ncbi:MAG: PadR family transcriptional regulator [Gemmatimonadetes bacterium]|nr:PadR family transcriptional regulator [Gemmatimonadota bacterium]